METNNDIWSKLRDITKNINLGDVVEKPNKSYCESYKYKSKTKKGKNGHIFFLYLHLRKNVIQVLFDTGANHSLYDPKNITLRENRWRETIPSKILVKPEDINFGKYTYDYIEGLIKQCYKTLNLPK